MAYLKKVNTTGLDEIDVRTINRGLKTLPNCY